MLRLRFLKNQCELEPKKKNINGNEGRLSLEPCKSKSKSDTVVISHRMQKRGVCLVGISC